MPLRKRTENSTSKNMSFNEKDMWQKRTEVLIGKEKLDKLKNSHVTVVGLGGVGGYVAVLLVRAGIENFTLIDFDKVEETNLNRQIIATQNTLGMPKTEALSQLLKSINPCVNLSLINERLTKDNLNRLINKDADYVIDAIDSVKDKTDLCDYCYKNKIKIISSMGSGNRFSVPEYQVLDIYKTENDGLAKVMRKNLKERGVKKLKVVATKQQAMKVDGVVGSISYHPCACACVICAEVVNDLIK